MGKTAQGSALSGAMRTAWACLLAVVLAVGCGLGTGLTAWAADDDEATTTYTITVNNASSGSYSVYQIFTGSFDESYNMGDALLNSTVQSYVLKALEATGESYAVDADDYSTATALANAVMDAIEDIDEAGLAQTFASNLATALMDANVNAYATGTYSEGTVTASVDATGYYLVVQTATADDDTSGSITSAILVPVTEKGATPTAKQSSPTATKSVVLDETTGSALTIAEDGSATITYQVTGTVASNIADYGIYYYAFVDTMPTGVSADDTSATDVKWTIYADETNITSSFTATGSTSDEASTLTWACADLTAIVDSDGAAVIDGDSVLTLTYTVTLSAEEVEAYLSTSSDYDSLTNTVYITYSNDPYTSSNGVTGKDDDDPTGTSPETQGTIYFYTLTVNKVDDYNYALDGAVFTLTGTNGYNVVSTGSNGTFTFTGLEAGVTYTLSETTVPSGYKTIEDIVFTINVEADTANTTFTYNVTESSDVSNAFTATVDGTTRTVTATVVNVAGASLPVTGAQGILLGLIIGGALVLVSAVTLLRRRKNAAE